MDNEEMPNLHRILGSAWYRNRKQEEDRLRAAISTAIAAPIRGRLSAIDDVIERPVIETAEVDRDAVPEWTSPYQKATVAALPRWVNPSDSGSRFDVTTGIEQIATVEGPVHMDVVLQRVRDAWNIGRAGSKIRANIDAAINLAHVVRDGDFIDVPGRLVASVRVPAMRSSARWNRWPTANSIWPSPTSSRAAARSTMTT